jgi:hypothetical protein
MHPWKGTVSDVFVGLRIHFKQNIIIREELYWPMRIIVSLDHRVLALEPVCVMRHVAPNQIQVAVAPVLVFGIRETDELPQA